MGKAFGGKPISSLRVLQTGEHRASRCARLCEDVARHLSMRCEWKPETVLDVADSRTLKKLETRAGLKGGRGTPTPTIEQFLGTQQWISCDNAALRLIRYLPIEQG
jgi:hypothetical protein